MEAKILGFNNSFSDFISISSPQSENDILLLVDTEADVSIIKISTLKKGITYNATNPIAMRGITNERQHSMGSLNVFLKFKHLTIEHTLHLVEDDFPIPSNGIIGKDFLKRHNCLIDYRDMTLKVRPNGFRPATVKIQNESNNGRTTVPARSETFKMFKIRSEKFPCLIETREIDKNIFIPTTIVHESDCWIRVLNVNDEDVTILTDILEPNDTDDYKIYAINGNSNSKSYNYERSNQLTQILNAKMPQHAKAKLIPLCMEFEDIFHLPDDKPTVNNFYSQKLNLRDNEPVYVKNYRLPQSQKSEIHSQVKQLLDNELIEMSTSNFNSPLIVVPKKSTDGSKKWRMCVDFRLLNRNFIPDKFPLPRIDEILDSLGRAKFFSVMDLQAGFHQIPLDKNSRPYTAFSTDNGFYQWTVLPFGLNIAPSSFTRMMTIAFAGLSPDKAFIYMDDIIVIGISENHHIRNIRSVFETCRKFNLKLNPQKCDFFRTEVQFLGHKCTNIGITPDPTKINVVQRYPVPKNGNETKRFVAFANYYRRFIPNFAEIAKPLNNLSKKRTQFIWNDRCQKSFNKLRNSLTNPPILTYPNFEKRFRVTVDASMSACAAYLSQEHEGIDKPIAYISRSFKKGELNKPIIEKELIAIQFAITSFRPYLFGREFTVFSDHKPLLYLYRLKNPSSKLNRLRLDMEEYTFEIVHIPGKDNVIADAFSRIHIEELKNQYTHEIFAITRSMTYNERSKNNNFNNNLDFNREVEIKSGVIEEFYSGYLQKVPRIKTLHFKVKNNRLEHIFMSAYRGHMKIYDIELKAKHNEKIDLKAIFSKLNSLSASNKVHKVQLLRNDKIFQYCDIELFKETGNKQLKNLYISIITRPEKIDTKEEQLQIMNKFHNDPLYGGHSGQKRMYSQIRSRYYWRRMTYDISNFVKKCHICKMSKPGRKTKEPMKITNTPAKPFDLVQIDTIGPLMKSNNGYQYALTIICDLTKYLVAVPLLDKSAKTVARAIFEKFILVYGPMRCIRTDRGTEYCNEVMNELLELMKTEHKKSTAYHHESLGTVERNHRFLNEYLRAYLNGNLAEWDVYLGYFAFYYNTAKSTTNDMKYSPFELVFGRTNTLPNEILDGKINPIYNIDNYVHELRLRLQLAHKETKSIIEKLKLRNKEYYDKNINSVKFKIGDKIKIQCEPYNKHKFIYNGPFDIVSLDNENVTVNLNGKLYTVHKNRILKYD